MPILTDDTVTVCPDDCAHPDCLRALADLWADAIQPLLPPF